MALHELDIFNRALSRVGDSRLTLSGQVAISAVTKANPAVVTTATHSLATGDFVLIRAIVGMTELNLRVFRVTVLSSTTFELDDEDSSGHTAWVSGGTADKLPTLKATQSCYDAWPDIRDEVLRAHPWNGVTKRSRLARKETAKTITGATAANPVVVTTSAAHGYSDGDQVLVEAVVGMTEINDRWFSVTTISGSTTTFQLTGEDGTTHAAYSSAGTTKRADTPFVPDSGFGARYSLPSDSLRILEIVHATHADLWMVEGDELLCDITKTVKVRYIQRVKDVTRYEPLLASAIAERLASEIAEELTQSTSKEELHLQKYQRLLALARGVDAQEASSMPPAEDPWVSARG